MITNYKKQAVKSIFIQEKSILGSTFNRGLALTGFRTTRPWLPNFLLRIRTERMHFILNTQPGK